MIICGFGSTRFYGGIVKSMENVLNIMCGFRNRLERMYGTAHANEVIVALAKLVVCGDTEKEQEAKTEFLKLMSDIVRDSEIMLRKEDS